MLSEDSEKSETCSLCIDGKLKFTHINLEEDVKICMNEQCVYPFAIGVIDEFVPSKIKGEKGAHSYASIAELMNKLEKEYNKDCLEWDRFADNNEFLTNIDQKAACEFVDDLDEPSIKKEPNDEETNEGFLSVQKFLNSLDDPSNTSEPPRLCRDPVISKLIQSHINTGETDVNRDVADEDLINSVITELEETKGKSNANFEMDMQWDADDFNAESFEMKENNEINTPFTRSEDDSVTSEQRSDEVSMCTDITAAESEYLNLQNTHRISEQVDSEAMDQCSSIAATESNDNTIIIDNINIAIDPEAGDVIIGKYEDVAFLTDHTYFKPIHYAEDESEVTQEIHIDNISTTSGEGNCDLIIGKYEEIPCVPDNSMHCASASVSEDIAGIESQMDDINITCEQDISDVIDECENAPLVPDNMMDDKCENAPISNNVMADECENAPLVLDNVMADKCENALISNNVMADEFENAPLVPDNVMADKCENAPLVPDNVMADKCENAPISNNVMADKCENAPLVPDNVMADKCENAPISNNVMADECENAPLVPDNVMADKCENAPISNNVMADKCENAPLVSGNAMADKCENTPLVPDAKHTSIPAMESETQTNLGNLSIINPYAKTMIIQCKEYIPLQYHLGLKFVKSICVFQPPKKTNSHSKSNFQTSSTTPTGEEGTDIKKTTVEGPVSAEMCSKSPNFRPAPSDNLETSVATTKDQASAEPDKLHSSAFNTLPTSMPVGCMSKEWQSGLETRGAPIKEETCVKSGSSSPEVVSNGSQFYHFFPNDTRKLNVDKFDFPTSIKIKTEPEVPWN